MIDKIKDIPEEITNKITAGWIAALVSVGITVGIMLVSLNFGSFNLLFNKWSYVDIIFISIFAFGVYKKSRIASTSLVIFFLASKLYLLINEAKIFHFIISMIFLFFYFRAMIGTYKYHSFLKAPNNMVEDIEEKEIRQSSTIKIVIGIICFIISAFFVLGFLGAISQDGVPKISMGGHVLTIMVTVIIPLIVGVILVFKR